MPYYPDPVATGYPYRMSLLACAVLCISQSLCTPSVQHTYSLSQYMAMKRANGPTLSQGADRVAYATNSSGNWQLWVVSVSGAGPRQLTKFSGGIGASAWSPRGENVLVVADRNGDQKYQFLLVSAVTAEVTTLTDNAETQNDFGGWSTDGKSIFYTSNARDPKYFDCYVMDIADKKPRLVYQRDSVMHAAAISNDGRFIALEETHSEVDNDILIVDTTTMTARSVTPHKGKSRFAAIGFSSDGGTLYYRSNDSGETMAVVAQKLSTGATTVLIRRKGDVDYAVIDRSGRRLAISENVDGFEELSVWDIKTNKRLPLPRVPRGVNTPQQFSADATKLAIVVSTPVHDDEVWIIDLNAKTMNQVTHSFQGGIAESDLILPKTVRYRTFDGRTIPALYYEPKGSSSNRRVPVILSIHGGPEGQEQPYLTNYYQFLVSRGYAILAPNVRGSTGYGKSYVGLDNGPLRWNALKDVAYAVRWIKEKKNLDASKVACFGPSYGGFVTLAMLAHYPDLFAAGVDFYGPCDLKSFLNRTAEYRRPIRMAEYGDPVRDSDFMDAISPARHAGKIKAPLLVVQGETDPIVPKAESEDIVRLVRESGGTAEYLLFPDEGHGFSKEADYVTAFERMLTFLMKHMPPSSD